MRTVILPFGQQEFTVESLSAWRVVDKLAREGIAVLSAKEHSKNLVSFAVKGKDAKKVFAILRSSCYNIKKVRALKLSRVLLGAGRRLGLIAGALAFVIAVCCFQTRVLKINVTGSGAYYSREVMAILKEEGVAQFSKKPKEESAITAKILSLPRVSFCSVKLRGGIFTVAVEVSDDDAFAAGEPLISPVAGVIEEIITVRGTPLVAAGDSVEAGRLLVENATLLNGEKVPVIVIARVKIAFPFEGEEADSEEAAILNATLAYGQIKELHTIKSGDKWSAAGVAIKEISRNLT